MVERELFRVLGLRPGASSDEIRSAYRTLAKKYHPDSRGGSGNALAFTRVVAAYQGIMQARMTDTTPGQRRTGAAAKPRAQGQGLRARQGGHEQTAGAAREGQATARYATAKAPHARPAVAEARQRAADTARPRPAADAARRPASDWTPHSHPASRTPHSRPAVVRSSITDMFALGRLLLMSGDPSVRASAARELGRSGKSSAYAFLRKAFSDRDQNVVLAAVKAVKGLAVRQSCGELSSLYSRSGPAVRKEILGVAVGFGGIHGFENILRLAVEDQDPSIRAEVLSSGWSMAGAYGEVRAPGPRTGWWRA